MSFIYLEIGRIYERERWEKEEEDEEVRSESKSMKQKLEKKNYLKKWINFLFPLPFSVISQAFLSYMSHLTLTRTQKTKIEMVIQRFTS